MVHVLSLHLHSLSLLSAVFVLITYTDRTSLYCSSEYLIVFEMRNAQLVDSTAFCTLAGLWHFLPAIVKAPIIWILLLWTVK